MKYIIFLGGWAFQSTMTSDEDPQFLSLPLPCETEPRLLFAGEATHGQFLGNLLGARFVIWLQYYYIVFYLYHFSYHQSIRFFLFIRYTQDRFRTSLKTFFPFFLTFSSVLSFLSQVG